MYRCTSTFSALKYCNGILIFYCNLSAIYTKLWAQTFSPIFFNTFFAIFNRNFAEIMAPPGNGNANSLVWLKGPSLLKRVKTEPKLTHTPWHSTCSNYDPVERTARRPRSVTEKQTYKHPIFGPTAGARSSIFSKLCTVIEDVETITKDANHVSIQRIVFLQGARRKISG